MDRIVVASLALPTAMDLLEIVASLVVMEASSSSEEAHHTLAAVQAEVVASWEAWAFKVEAQVTAQVTAWA